MPANSLRIQSFAPAVKRKNAARPKRHTATRILKSFRKLRSTCFSLQTMRDWSLKFPFSEKRTSVGCALLRSNLTTGNVSPSMALLQTPSFFMGRHSGLIRRQIGGLANDSVHLRPAVRQPIDLVSARHVDDAIVVCFLQIDLSH